MESSAGQPMALDTPAGEELSQPDFFEVRLLLTLRSPSDSKPARLLVA